MIDKPKNRVKEFYVKAKGEFEGRLPFWGDDEKISWKTVLIIIGFTGMTAVTVLGAIATAIIRILEWYYAANDLISK